MSGCGADGSALPWGGRGRGFKSRHSDHFKSPYLRRLQGIVSGVCFYLKLRLRHLLRQLYQKNKVKHIP